jgi:succinyl-CoA synthetase beta subunit
MDIHEYQAKKIFRSHDLPVPPGRVARSPGEAQEMAADLGGPVVVKAQVHAGGRGKAGGVKIVDDAPAARRAADEILGMEIKGLVVRKVLVTPAVEIESEAYAGVIMDRGSGRPVFMVSPEGGMDIERVAEEKPDAIKKLPVDPRYGLLANQANRLAYFLYDDPELARRAAGILGDLWSAYRDAGATLAEINPLVATPEGELAAIDAKMTIDDNELFRQERIAEMRDEEAEDDAERTAREAGLSYIKLDGDVGCCVNGAGLAMATMDLVKYYGGEPANFLDIGGSSSPDKVVSALEIITSDEGVGSILFNIFGGITRCDDVANGLVEATDRMELDVPLTIRLTGTNEEEAVRILEEHGFEAMVDMDRAVQRAVELAD